ncbi:hypothetical protein DJ564_12830 [Pseudomonas sp. 31-12]|uniref:hypothetical protein n=1 Tax=Pseudomonas sp. 31-12 TaxID=2201356 RepID=UPI000D6AF194|nr:hypothetical protein [Pseudomonas sp. 31-12]AWM91646.1 hypothetical protein DJ564_12830 [Pseudomonas sp. 31-12]
MDATFLRPFSFFSLLTVAVILSGCQATTPAQIKTPEAQPGFAVFNSVLLETPEPNSIVREGDRITYLVTSSPSPDLHYLARFDAHCSQPDAQMAYRSKAGMSLFAANPRGRSEDARQLPAEQKSQYLQSAQLKQVCAQTTPPQWRVLSAPDHQDWQMIDRSSLTVKGDEVTFWTARVLPGEMLMPGKNALYGQVRQRWTANCGLQQLTALSHFYLDTHSRVLAGSMQTEPKAIGLQSLGADERQLIQVACGTPQSLDQYKPFEGREQSPFEPPAPVVAAPVLKAIEALNMPKPEKSIQHLRRVFKDNSEPRQYSDEGLRLNGRDSTYLSSEAGNQLTERYEDRRGHWVKATFRGLIVLAESEFSTRAGEISIEDKALTNLSFEGDWAHMPVGALLRYTAQDMQLLYTNNGKGPRALVPVDNRYSCEVQSQKPASTFHPSLTGTAKVISCVQDAYQYSTDIYVYLEAYGMFVPFQYVTKNVQAEWTIEVVES